MRGVDMGEPPQVYARVRRSGQRRFG
jgi:hypothetical protein